MHNLFWLLALRFVFFQEKSKKNQLRVEEPKTIEGGENKDGNDGDHNAVPVEGPTPILRNEDIPFETVEGKGAFICHVSR